MSKSGTSSQGARAVVYVAAAFICGLLVGTFVDAHKHHLGPFLRAAKTKVFPSSNASGHAGTHDRFGRLTSYPDKVAVACPPQWEETGVVLVLGQSNAANTGETRFRTRHPGRVFNYFDGRCYLASSPLLGATGEDGEFVTLMADDLVSSNVYRNVVIVSSGISGTPISRWQRDGDLNEMLRATLAALRRDYRVTDVIWHQGESDLSQHTTAALYQKAFETFLATIEEFAPDAPVFVAVATRCKAEDMWRADNPVARAQQALVNDRTVFLGADSDALVGFDERTDRCHFNEAGQRKVAAAFAHSVRSVRLRHLNAGHTTRAVAAQSTRPEAAAGERGEMAHER